MKEIRIRLQGGSFVAELAADGKDLNDVIRKCIKFASGPQVIDLAGGLRLTILLHPESIVPRDVIQELEFENPPF